MDPMTITFVNGYLCENASDVAKARAGQNPHPQSDTTESVSGGGKSTSGGKATDSSTSINSRQKTTANKPSDAAAVVYGGRLAGGSAGNKFDQAPTSKTADTAVTKSNVDTLA
jgi:hypothetical protein